MTEGGVSTSNNSTNGVFKNVDEAIAEAKKAQTVLFSSKLELRERIIASIRDTLKSHITELSELAVKETGMGRVADKELKIELLLKNTWFRRFKSFCFQWRRWTYCYGTISLWSDWSYNSFNKPK